MSAARTIAAQAPAAPTPRTRTRPSRRQLHPVAPPTPPRSRARPAPATPALVKMQADRDDALLHADAGAMLHAEASAYHLLTAAQERTLARRWRHSGDTAARDELVTRNIRLVEWWVDRARLHTHLLPRAELIAEGMLGLLRAAEKYDPESGHRFTTYATWWIRQAVGRYADDQGALIRLPVYQRQRERALRRISERYLLEKLREPTEDELVWELNQLPRWNHHHGAPGDPERPPITRESLRELRAGVAPVMALDWSPDPDALDPHSGEINAASPFLVGNQTDAADQAAEEALEGVLRGLDERRLVTLLQRLLRYGRLSPREVCALARRYGLGQTQREIGAYLGVSREMARQYQLSGLRKLRAYLRECGVRSVQAWMGEEE